MVRIKDGNYIAIFHDRMIEVKANEKHEAYEKAKNILNQESIENCLMVN